MINKADKQRLFTNYGLFLLISAQIFYIIGSLLANFIILLIVVSYIILDKNNLKNLFLERKLLIISLIFFIFLNIVTSHYQYYSSIKILEYSRFFLFPVAIIFFLNLIKDKIKIYVNFLIFLILFLVFDSFIQFYFGRDIFGFEYNNLYKRISGPFGDEWILGTYLLYIGFLTISYLNNVYKIKNSINYFLFVIISITILYTGERSSYLSIYYLLTFVFIFSSKKKFIFFTSILIILFSFLAINFNENLKNKYNLLNLPKVDNKVLDQSNESDNTPNNLSDNFIDSKLLKFFVTFKNSKWAGHSYRSFQIFKDNIFFGSGFRTYKKHCYNYDDDENKKITKCSTHPHNFHSEIISDNGLIGYLIFLTLIFITIISFIKNKLYKSFEISIIFSLILTFIFPIKTTGSFFTTNSSFIFWILIGHYFYLMSSVKNKN